MAAEAKHGGQPTGQMIGVDEGKIIPFEGWGETPPKIIFWNEIYEGVSVPESVR